MVVSKGGGLKLRRILRLDIIETVITLRQGTASSANWVRGRVRKRNASALLETQERWVHFRMNARNAFFGGGGQRPECFDAMQEDLTGRTLGEQVLAEDSARFVLERLLAQVDGHNAWAASPSPDDREAFISGMIDTHRHLFRYAPQVYDVEGLVMAGLAALTESKYLSGEQGDVLVPLETRWTRILGGVKSALGFSQPDFYEETTVLLEDFRDESSREWTKQTNREMFEPAMRKFGESLLAEIESSGTMREIWKGKETPPEITAADIGRSFGETAFLWTKTKNDIVAELNDAYIRSVGQTSGRSAINRVDMLATGVGTTCRQGVWERPGPNPDPGQRGSGVLAGIPGAVDVVADQTVGKGRS